jgi:hypothetical protein
MKQIDNFDRNQSRKVKKAMRVACGTNPKFEFLSPKQAQNPNVPMTETKAQHRHSPVIDGRSGFGDLDFGFSVLFRVCG